MDPVAQAASKIIKEQQAIIGPVAIAQARKVSGLVVKGIDDIEVTGNKKEALERLVAQFEKLFGRASVQVCKEAFEPFSNKIAPSDIPEVLKN